MSVTFVKCRPHRVENEIKTCETRSSKADRTKFGSEDIEWCLLCWHRDWCRLTRIPYALSCMLFSTSHDFSDLSAFGHILNYSVSPTTSFKTEKERSLCRKCEHQETKESRRVQGFWKKMTGCFWRVQRDKLRIRTFHHFLQNVFFVEMICN